MVALNEPARERKIAADLICDRAGFESGSYFLI